jgi:hypothetical protein
MRFWASVQELLMQAAVIYLDSLVSIETHKRHLWLDRLLQTTRLKNTWRSCWRSNPHDSRMRPETVVNQVSFFKKNGVD